MTGTPQIGEPTRLEGRRLAFVGWRHVTPGTFQWVDADGVNQTVVGDVPPGEARHVPTRVARGVRLDVRSAERSATPIVAPPVDPAAGLTLGTLLRDGDVFRAWGAIRMRGGGKRGILLESADGESWAAPELLDDGRYRDEIERIGPTVFIDPADVPERRYKSIGETFYPVALGREHEDVDEPPVPPAWRPDVTPQLARMFGQEGGDDGVYVGAGGWTSPDGREWTRIEDPLLIAHTDTQITCAFDPARGRYVGYFRGFSGPPLAEAAPVGTVDLTWEKMARRLVTRAETADFEHWPTPTPVLGTAPWMAPSQTVYTNAWTRLPGAPDAELMLPTVWDTARDATEVHIAGTIDGRSWDWLRTGPVLPPAPSGAWDAGATFLHPELVELPGSGDFVASYTGYNVPHKYPRGRWSFAPGLARWRRGRVVGIRGDADGEFTTVALVPPGERVTINAECEPGGSIRVGLERLDGSTVPGRGIEDCRPIDGDAHGAPISWLDGERIPTDEAVRIVVEVRDATVFWLEFD